MKRILVILSAVFVMLVSTASCGVAENNSSVEPNTVGSTDAEKPTAACEPTPESEQTSVPPEPETEEAFASGTLEPEESTVPESPETETAAQEDPPVEPDFSLYRVEISVKEDKDFAYTRDREGSLCGAADYWIDGEYAYILSTSSNTITVFRNQEVIRKISFENGENGGMNLLQFAVKGDVAYAYAVNSEDSYLVKYVNWEPVASMSIYDFTSVDGFTDFYIKDGDLYVVSLSDRTFDDMTCRIHEEDGKLVCFEKRRGKLVDGLYFEKNSEVRSALETVTASQAEKDHFRFVAQVGTADCGTDGDGGHYYLSIEVVSDEVQEYLIQRIYHFDADGGFLESAHIPGDVHVNILQTVKVFFGTPWTLYLSEESVALLPLKEAAEAYDLQDSLLEIDWS